MESAVHEILVRLDKIIELLSLEGSDKIIVVKPPAIIASCVDEEMFEEYLRTGEGEKVLIDSIIKKKADNKKE